MIHSLDDVSRIMGMKASEITTFVNIPEGTLVTTREGAQTLIRPDRSTVPVRPGSTVLNIVGRGSVQRFADQQPRPPIRVEATVGKPVDPTPAAAPAEVPAGTATEVLTWVNGDVDKAKLALEAEKQRQAPRAGLTAQLEKIAG